MLNLISNSLKSLLLKSVKSLGFIIRNLKYAKLVIYLWKSRLMQLSLQTNKKRQHNQNNKPLKNNLKIYLQDRRGQRGKDMKSIGQKKFWHPLLSEYLHIMKVWIS